MKTPLFLTLLFFSTHLFSQIITTNGIATGCVPAVFIFKKKNPQGSYNWNLGNGSFSTLDSASATFTTPGTYTITEGTDKFTITVYNKPTISIDSLSKTFGCLPFSFSLKDKTILPAGINATNYLWTFGDGSTATGSTINHTITNYEPNVNVSLTIYTDVPSCDNTILFPNYIKTLSKPKASIKIDNAYSCLTPFTTKIENASTASQYNQLTYKWSSTHPSNNTSNSKDLGSKTYNSSTTDSITLITTNQYGCSDTAKNYVVIEKPELIVEAPDTFCGETDAPLFMNIKLLDYVSNDDRYEYYIDNTPLSYGGRVGNNLYLRTLVSKEGSYSYTITKFRKDKPDCRVSITKSIYIIYFKPNIFFDSIISECRLPIKEYTKATNLTSSVDSIFWEFSYYDKYDDEILNNKIRNKSDVLIAKSILDNYVDPDSFYRKGNFKRFLSLTYYNKKYGCHNSDYSSVYYKNLFYAYITSNKRKGCIPLTINTSAYTYYSNEIDSVKIFWGDGTSSNHAHDTAYNFVHTYTNPGTYRISSIAFDKLGCKDTTNSIWIEASEEVLTKFYKSDDSLCLGDTLYLEDTSSLALRDKYFLSGTYETNSCGSTNSSYLIMKKNTGWQKVFFYYNYNGCNTRVADSVYTKGTTFRLNYDYKCQYRDSFTFKLDSLAYNGTDSFLWDFGDGKTIISKNKIIGHKYSRGDYMVKVSNYSTQSYCPYIDSVPISIRNVKAIMKGDSMLCDLNDSSYLYSLNYILDPTLSKDADYQCTYTYSWIIKDLSGKKYPIMSHDKPIEVDFPKDTFDLSLIARDVNGCEDTSTRRMRINKTTANFGLNKNSLCGVNDSIQAFDSSIATVFGIKDREWFITSYPYDNIIISGKLGKNPVFKFSNNTINKLDTIKISLKVIDSNDCESSIFSKLVPVVKDTSKIIGKDTICQNTAFQFSNTVNTLSTFNYYWYLNDKIIDSNKVSINVIASTTGVNKLVLKKIHKASQCEFPITKYFRVLAKPQIRIDNTYDTSNYRCYPATTRISAFDTLGLTYKTQWNFNSNSPTFLNPSNFVLNAGINKIKAYISTDYGCLDSFENLDTVYDVKAKLNFSKKLACFGDEINFSLSDQNSVSNIYWDFGDGNFDNTNSSNVKHNFVKNVLSENKYIVNCIISAVGNLCAVSLTDTIKIYNIKSDFIINSGDTDFCFTPSVPIQINSPNADKFDWYISNGSKYLNQNLTSINLPKPGKYFVTLYSSKADINCIDSITKGLVLYPYPYLKVKTDTSCLGQKTYIQFSDTLNKTKVYLQPDVNFGSPYTKSPIELKLDSTVNLKIIAESEYLCRDTLINKIPLIIFKPLDTLIFDTIVEVNKPVKLPVTLNPLWTYTWSPPLLNPSCQNCNNPEVKYLDSMVHTLYYKDYRGCFNLSNQYIIRIYPQITVKVPTAFTPNGDGNNDILYARGFGIKKLTSFKIYNRTGQLLFFTQDEHNGWDGTYKGKMQNTEPYYYTFEAESYIPGKTVSGEGSFMLIR